MDALDTQRMEAAHASGGISSEPIYQMALRCLDAHQAHGAALDFGAGKGSFSRLLLASGKFENVAGIDLMARPDGLPEAVAWTQADLNERIDLPSQSFDTITAVEVIEHLENPRQFFRTMRRLLRPEGVLVLTTPNCESFRSMVTLWFRGHFAGFGAESYPAHITPLLNLDLQRAAKEAGLLPLGNAYSNTGAVPGLTWTTWQKITLGLARGRRCSDNFAFICRRS